MDEAESSHLLASSDHDHDSDPTSLSSTLSSFAQHHNLIDALPILLSAAQTIQHPDGSREPTPKWQHPLPFYLIILTTALGALTQGWTQTGINGATLYFPMAFNIGSTSSHDTLLVGFINAGIYLSNGLLGCWLVAPLNARFGRRGAVFIGGLVSVLGNVAGALAGSWQVLLAWRLLLGLGLAVVAGTVNVLLAETAPASVRGGVGVVWQMFTAAGIFVGFLVNMLVDNSVAGAGARGDEGVQAWRIMLGAAALPTLPMLGIVWLCPESPAWLIKTSARYDRAYASLCRLRNNDVIAAKELLEFYSRDQEQEQEDQILSTPRKHSHSAPPSLLTQLTGLLSTPRLRRATLAAYTTQLAQILCGINIVAFYSSSIFVSASFSNSAAETASTIFGLLNTLGAIPAIWAMDAPRWGRRALLLYALPPMGLSLGIAGAAFALPDSWAGVRFAGGAAMIYLFCLLYSPSLGPVPAAYSAEVFPLSHREVGMSTAVSVANLAAAALSLTFPYLLAVLGTPGAFGLYAVLNGVAWCLVFVFVPETKGRSLGELDLVFQGSVGAFVKERVSEARERLRR